MKFLKSKVKKGSAQVKEGSNDCVIPSKIPIEHASEYRAKNDHDAEMDIAGYIESQASDETVINVELLKEETVYGTKYEMWDVATDKNRWWVITNPTNLYSQELFQSLDYTLSFHIGLMHRVGERESRKISTDGNPLEVIARRLQQAEDRFVDAIEAEDFQGVGVALRETLVALIGIIRTRIEITSDEDLPKGSDFKNWSTLIIDHTCQGRKNRELRKQLKAMASGAWDLANRVTHNTEANNLETKVAIDLCHTITDNLITMMIANRAKGIERCHACQSRNLRNFYDPLIEEIGDYYLSCGVCGWSNHPNYQD